MPSPAGPAPLDPALERVVLATGDIDLKGRVLPASNVTFFGEITVDGATLACVYKPISGERPLWDFPDGTLAAREVAAFAVSEALGWDVVPPTIMREGPVGVGMVQAWREPDPTQDPVDIVPESAVPEGFLHVLDALDGEDRAVSLVHEDSAALRRMAVFDVVVNNADRKGGHILPMPCGHRHGVDHGVSFHVENKLRTVLWGWADQPVAAEDLEALAGLLIDLREGQLRQVLDDLLSQAEIAATIGRCEALLSSARMPVPSGAWPAIPWPAF